MSGLLLSEDTKDLLITDGNLQLSVDSTTALRQRIQITLNAWLGEWKLNTAFGIPYKQNVFVKGVTKAGIDAIFLAKIIEFDEVESIDAFESELDFTSRKYEIIRLVVKTTTVFATTVDQFHPDDDTEYQPSSISEIGNICVII